MEHNKKAVPQDSSYGQGGNRTLTIRKLQVFETCASTSSATCPEVGKYYSIINKSKSTSRDLHSGRRGAYRAGEASLRFDRKRAGRKIIYNFSGMRLFGSRRGSYGKSGRFIAVLLSLLLTPGIFTGVIPGRLGKTRPGSTIRASSTGNPPNGRRNSAR